MPFQPAIKWLLFIASAALICIGGWLFVSAFVTADMRFGHCGASSVDHAEAYCRVAMTVLDRAYAVWGFAAVLFLAALLLRKKRARVES